MQSEAESRNPFEDMFTGLQTVIPHAPPIIGYPFVGPGAAAELYGNLSLCHGSGNSEHFPCTTPLYGLSYALLGANKDYRRGSTLRSCRGVMSDLRLLEDADFVTTRKKKAAFKEAAVAKANCPNYLSFIRQDSYRTVPYVARPKRALEAYMTLFPGFDRFAEDKSDYKNASGERPSEDMTIWVYWARNNLYVLYTPTDTFTYGRELKEVSFRNGAIGAGSFMYRIPIPPPYIVVFDVMHFTFREHYGGDSPKAPVQDDFRLARPSWLGGAYYYVSEFDSPFGKSLFTNVDTPLGSADPSKILAGLNAAIQREEKECNFKGPFLLEVLPHVHRDSVG